MGRVFAAGGRRRSVVWIRRVSADAFEGQCASGFSNPIAAAHYGASGRLCAIFIRIGGMFGPMSRRSARFSRFVRQIPISGGRIFTPMVTGRFTGTRRTDGSRGRETSGSPRRSPRRIDRNLVSRRPSPRINRGNLSRISLGNPRPANPDRGRSPDMGQLDRDRTARQQGDQRGNSGWSPGGRDSGGRDSGGGGQRR